MCESSVDIITVCITVARDDVAWLCQKDARGGGGGDDYEQGWIIPRLPRIFLPTISDIPAKLTRAFRKGKIISLL